MLKKIKSIFFSRILFSILEEKIKLDIIKYNKNLQNMLSLTLINYKRISGKYIIFEKNEKVKEFIGHDDSLVYEGEYLNGKRHGKGKEYDDFNGRLLFKGEYLNGKRHGKGKEYNDFNSNLKYEGEYLNGKRHGKGKEYNDFNGNLI